MRCLTKQLTIASSEPAKLCVFLCESLSLHYHTKRCSALQPADAGRYLINHMNWWLVN